MAKELKKFFVLNWDFNADNLYHFDVLPYFRNVYKERVKSWKKTQKSKRFQKNTEFFQKNIAYYKAPETRDELKNFILGTSAYMFWGRCEYELICHGFPCQKNDYKLDVHEQIKMNVDIIAGILAEEFGLEN